MYDFREPYWSAAKLVTWLCGATDTRDPLCRNNSDALAEIRRKLITHQSEILVRQCWWNNGKYANFGKRIAIQTGAHIVDLEFISFAEAPEIFLMPKGTAPSNSPARLVFLEEAWGEFGGVRSMVATQGWCDLLFKREDILAFWPDPIEVIRGLCLRRTRSGPKTASGRDAEITRLLNSGQDPGSNTDWKTFCRKVRGTCHVADKARGFSDRAIKRAVEAVRAGSAVTK